MIRNRSSLTLVPAFFAILLWGGALTAHAQSTCRGIGGLKCPTGQACQYPVNQCNIADLAGTCVAVPDTCPTNGKKVCGCDGTTYANECQLLKAGAREAHKGACTAPAPKLTSNDLRSTPRICASKTAS